MNQVKRAVIMAAGIGSRMRPATLTTPKPMIRIGGKRIIDFLLEGLNANGIEEIYVVAGYRKEQLYVLEQDYPGLKIVENPYYENCNNISSLYMVRDHLEDVLIADADQIIRDQSILAPEFEKSGYNAVRIEGETKEWLMQADESGNVLSCSRTGGRGGWELYGISRWTAEDGRKLKRHLEYEFEEKKNRQIYWDDVPMFCHFDEYKLKVRPMAPGKVQEVDSYEDLRKLDPSYL